MSRKIVLLVSSLFALSLVGCASPTNNSSSSAPASSVPASSSEPVSSASVEKEVDLAEFLSKFAGLNYTVEFEGFVNYAFFSKDAIYATYLGDYASYGAAGSINVGTQGMFDFTIDNGAITLGNCDSSSAEATISWFYYTLEDLAGSAKAWTSTGVTNAYTSSDATIGAAIACLGGYSDYANSGKATFATQLVIGEQADAAVIKTTMTYNKKTYTADAEVTAIGTTANATVTSFLAAPPTLTAKTAWGSATQTAMTSLLNEIIPLPTGTSCNTYESVTTDDNGAISDITLQDFGSGDILAAYQAQLIADGWTLSTERTDETGDMEKYGYVMYMYEKVKTAATSKAGKIVYTLQVDYKPVSAYSSATGKKVYPKGTFQIVATVYQYPLVITTDVAGLNTYYADIKKADATAAIPTLAFASTVTGVTITDYSLTAAAVYGMDFVNYSDAKIAIATEADALTDLATIGAALVSAGYTDGETTIADDGYLSYSLSDDAFAMFGMSITLSPDFASDGTTYAGSVTIEVIAA